MRETCGPRCGAPRRLTYSAGAACAPRAERGDRAVLPATTGADDRFVVGADKTAPARAHTRPPDWKAVEDLLGLLARAIQQLHTYPPTSPICINAIEACQRAVATLSSRDALAFRVSPD